MGRKMEMGCWCACCGDQLRQVESDYCEDCGDGCNAWGEDDQFQELIAEMEEAGQRVNN